MDFKNLVKSAVGLVWEGENEPTTENNKVTNPVTPQVAVPTTLPVGVIEEKFTKHFTDLIANAKITNTAYSKFSKANDVLSGVIPDQAIRYQTALKTLDSVTKDAILASANEFLALLQSDNKDYNEVVVQKKKNELDTRQTEIQRLNDDIAAKQEQIQTLNAAIQANNTKISSLQGEVILETNKIETSHQNYQASLNTFSNKIQSDITNITNYLV